MRTNIFIFLLGISVILSCKNETKANKQPAIGADGPEKTAKQNDGLTLLSGEFIFYKDAAVLQTGNEVYGVKIDEKMHELYKMGESFRKEDTDGVRAVIRGKIIPLPKGEEGWPFSVQVEEIVSVKELGEKANEVVKIGS